MRIALIQLQSGIDKTKNLEKTLSFCEEAAHRKAEFILLPEVFIFRGKIESRKHLAAISEPIEGGAITAISAIAKDLKVSILAGSIYEKVKNSSKVYNTSVLVGPDGRIKSIYRKKHLFDANLKGRTVRESKTFLAGEKTSLAAVGEFKLGLSICFDLRFPEMYRSYSKHGADLLCVPSAFTKETGEKHWEVLLRARAVENLCYVLAPNQIGTDNRGITDYGHSLAVDPWGNVLAEGSAGKEEIIFASMDRKVVKQFRQKLPNFIK